MASYSTYFPFTEWEEMERMTCDTVPTGSGRPCRAIKWASYIQFERGKFRKSCFAILIVRSECEFSIQSNRMGSESSIILVSFLRLII